MCVLWFTVIEPKLKRDINIFHIDNFFNLFLTYLERHDRNVECHLDINKVLFFQKKFYTPFYFCKNLFCFRFSSGCLVVMFFMNSFNYRGLPLCLSTFSYFSYPFSIIHPFIHKCNKYLLHTVDKLCFYNSTIH